MRGSIPALVTCVIVAGALIRYFYNNVHADHSRAPWWAWLAAAVGAVGRVLDRDRGLARHAPGARPRARRRPRGRPRMRRRRPPTSSRWSTTRCSMCHAPEPAWEGIGEAPKGVLLDTPEHIAAFAPAIRMQAVLTHAMPPNNLTEMTPAERAILARWLGVAHAQTEETRGMDFGRRRRRAPADGAARRVRRLHRRAGQADAALSLRPPTAPPASDSRDGRTRPA